MDGLGGWGAACLASGTQDLIAHQGHAELFGEQEETLASHSQSLCHHPGPALSISPRTMMVLVFFNTSSLPRLNPPPTRSLFATLRATRHSCQGSHLNSQLSCFGVSNNSRGLRGQQTMWAQPGL